MHVPRDCHAGKPQSETDRLLYILAFTMMTTIENYVYQNVLRFTSKLERS